MEANKIIAHNYQIIKPLFQINSYLYVQLCSLQNHHVYNAALYVYENEDPSQSLKMLSQKLDLAHWRSELNYLIFPHKHIKENYNQKHLSIFFIKDYLVPLSRFQKNVFTTLQFLESLHGALSCLNQLHSRQIIHGNISLNTSYLLQHKDETRCKFSLNILDTSYFVGENYNSEIESLLYRSQGQSLGMNASFKDDLQSLVYVFTHLISKGKLFTVQKFQLQWVTEAELLRWKTCEFFKQMVKIVPPQLGILVEIYVVSRSMRRNQKPDYLKIIRKVLDLIAKYKRKLQKTNKTPKKSSRLKKNVTICENLNESDIEIEVKQDPKLATRNSQAQKKQIKTFQVNR